MLQFQLVLNLPTSNNQRPDLRNTWKRFKNPFLNIYTKLEAWEICLPGEINKIPKPMDEVVDIEAISYNYKRKSIMKRTTKKRRITLDHSILITIEEKLINTDFNKTSELIDIGMAITDSTLDREKRDEEELVISRKELEDLFHLVKYY
jgi:hypothetical protein